MLRWVLSSLFIIQLYVNTARSWPANSETPSYDENQENIPKSYNGYKLLRTSPIVHSQLADALLLSLDGKHGVHFWTFPRENETTDILASPRLFPHVQSLLDGLGVDHDVVHHDISEILAEENVAVQEEATGRQLASQHRMNWNTYHRYSDILGFCRFLSESRQSVPGGPSISMETIGRSTEGRDIVLVKISNGGSGSKPAIWLDGGMHAREWISPATVTYIMNALVTDSAKNSDLLNAFDWYFVPVVNVDGYEFTHTNDRFWRKTRSRTSSYLGCKGVDPNRNWGFMWGGAGTSNDPCSDVYRGPKAFSEPETLAVSQAILARRNQIKMYLTFHAYSQMILIPWGYGRQKPADYNELYNLGLKGKQALEATYRTPYRLGTAPDLLYSAAGGSDDWAKGAAGIKYSYTFELRDTGRYGFALPASQIKPTGEETFNAVRALALGLQQAGNKIGGSGGVPQKPRLPGYPKLPRPGSIGATDLLDDEVGETASNNYDGELPQ